MSEELNQKLPSKAWEGGFGSLGRPPQQLPRRTLEEGVGPRRGSGGRRRDSSGSWEVGVESLGRAALGGEATGRGVGRALRLGEGSGASGRAAERAPARRHESGLGGGGYGRDVLCVRGYLFRFTGGILGITGKVTRS